MLVDSVLNNDGAESENTGEFDGVAQCIRIKRGMKPLLQWLVYWHERTHVTFFELGVHMPKLTEEAACDAIAHARVWEMLHS